MGLSYLVLHAPCLNMWCQHSSSCNLATVLSIMSIETSMDPVCAFAAFLEQENVQLKWELTRLKSETSRLRAVLLAEDDNECDLVQN